MPDPRLPAALTALCAVFLLSPAPVALAGPDPVNGPPADGCQRNPTGLLTYTSPEWVFVNARSVPASGGRLSGDNLRVIEGSATLNHTAGEDLPESHASYDLDSDIVPDPAYAPLLAGRPDAYPGAPDPGNGNYAHDADFGKLHVEWESGSVPGYVWPTEGDRIKLWGQWIWDCGHWGQGIVTDQKNPQGSLQGTGDYFLPGQITGQARPADLRGEQTELHPLEAMVVTRAAPYRAATAATQTDFFVSNDGTHAYAEAQCARTLAPAPGGSNYGPDFSACVNDPANQRQRIGGRAYDFFVPAPPRPSPAARLTLREERMVSDGGAATEQLTERADGVSVHVGFDRVAPEDATPRAFGATYFVGWDQPGAPPTHLQFTLKSITVNHALGEPNPKHPTVAGNPVGRYNLYLDLNGFWNFIGGRAPEAGDSSWVPGLGAVTDGQQFAVGKGADFFVPAGKPVRLAISGRECDLPKMDPCTATAEVADGNDQPGETIVQFPTADAAIGEHRLASPLKQDDRTPNYEMTYSIRRTNAGSAQCGSTGVPSSSPTGSLGGGGSVLCPAADTAGAGTAGCAGASPPRSRIGRRPRASRRRIRIRGTSVPGRCARVARVEVAVARRSHGRCRFLTGSGRLGRRRPCSRPLFRPARGTTSWRLSRRGHFRRGCYFALVRATDSTGRVELLAGRGARRRFRIR